MTLTLLLHACRRKELFAMLKRLGSARTVEEYELRVTALKATPLYKGNPALQAYLDTEWFSCVEQWAAYARAAYHGGINTNNHVEALNRVIKQKWLNGRGDMRMESLLRVWFAEIEPYYAQQYIHDNVMSEAHVSMVRQDSLPAYAAGRPVPVIRELMQKDRLAQEAVAQHSGYVQPVRGRRGVFSVQASHATLQAKLAAAMRAGMAKPGTTVAQYKQQLAADPHTSSCLAYTVDIPAGTCACGHFTTRRAPCKHMMAVFHVCSEWAFNKLPASLLQQPHLVIDRAVATGQLATLPPGWGEVEEEDSDPDVLYAAVEEELEVDEQPEVDSTQQQAFQAQRAQLVALLKECSSAAYAASASVQPDLEAFIEALAGILAVLKQHNIGRSFSLEAQQAAEEFQQRGKRKRAEADADVEDLPEFSPTGLGRGRPKKKADEKVAFPTEAEVQEVEPQLAKGAKRKAGRAVDMPSSQVATQARVLKSVGNTAKSAQPATRKKNSKGVAGVCL